MIFAFFVSFIIIFRCVLSNYYYIKYLIFNRKVKNIIESKKKDYKTKSEDKY